MRRTLPALALICALASPLAAAADGNLQGLRLIEGDAGTRAELDLRGAGPYKVFSLHQPERLVIDLDRAALAPGFRLPAPNGVVTNVRTGRPAPGQLRVVFDLGAPVAADTRTERDGTGTRLIVDLHAVGAPMSVASTTAAPKALSSDQANAGGDAAALSPIVAPTVVTASAPPLTSVPAPVPTSVASSPAPAKSLQDLFGSNLRPLVVAIDAGHGGKDPGAHGPTGVHEKNVTLAVARELARQINADPGLKAVLIRDSDTFVPLQERYMRARAAQADLFISIHADASPSHTASGASVFVLSTRGATSQAARWLADQENAADLVGGVSLDDKDRNLSAVLLDLSQSATMRASDDVAGQVLSALKNVGKAHKGEVERANFVVLRSPDVPSMLVETGFITNPTEEKRLDDPDYRRRLASAIVTGVRAYFTDQPPPGSYYAVNRDARPSTREYVVGRGETLSLIAAQNGVPLNLLLQVNRKRDDSVQVGERLIIPSPLVASAPQ